VRSIEVVSTFATALHNARTLTQRFGVVFVSLAAIIAAL
jgi:hypothetical protein